jgi:hypothetical protein
MNAPFLAGDIHKTAYYPPLMNYFIEIDERDIFNSSNNLRHPGGIYNITCLYIVKSLSKFIAIYLDEKNSMDEVFDSFRLVIYDFFKFYDSCFEIMACFCDGESKLGNKDFIDKWIEKNGYRCSQDFKKEIGADLSVLKHLYNKLKHTSNRIAWIKSRSGKNVSIGYYLEVRDSEGNAAPFDNVNYPISLNKEVRNLYFLIFKISYVLENVLVDHTKVNNKNIRFKLSKKILDAPEWKALYNQIAVLPRLYLFNEIGKQAISVNIQSGKLIFSPETISQNDWSEIFKHELNVEYITGGDAYTKSFSVPTMGLKAENGEVKSSSIIGGSH